MKLLGIDNNSGSRFYRMIPILKYMATQGHEVKLISHNDRNYNQDINWCDVVILEMLESGDTVRDIKKLGKKVIFECDDLMHTVPKTHYLYEDHKGWKKFKMWWLAFQTVRQCDGFISTNKGLNRLYGWMARKSLVFDNYSDISHWLKEPKKNLDPNKIRVLWAGSTSHAGDLTWAKPILKTILKKYPQVQFVYIGIGGSPSNNLYTEFVYGEDFFFDLPKDQRESVLPVDATVWPYILASLQADIAIAPLEKNYFNKFKSQCKYLEYGINAIPGVYSKWFYTNVKDGETGFVADTKQEWIDKLSILIESSIIRKEMGEKAKVDIINNHSIDSHLPDYKKFIEDINGKGK